MPRTDAEVAADLLAETFAVAFERRRRFRDVGAPGATWIYGIAATAPTTSRTPACSTPRTSSC
jgi:hypothetical protein